MKRLIPIVFLATIIIAGQLSVNCSKPLDSSIIIPNPDPNTKDTVYLYDTLIITDTVITIDTIFGEDTTIIYDTITITDTFVDTIIDTVIQTDTVIIVDTLTISPTYCANLSSYQKTITWMLQNHAGTYHLEFVASGDNNDPKQVLIIEIDGEEIEWRPYDNSEIILDLDLDENSKAVISPTTPRAFGHAIAICLKVEKQ